MGKNLTLWTSDMSPQEAAAAVYWRSLRCELDSDSCISESLCTMNLCKKNSVKTVFVDVISCSRLMEVYSKYWTWSRSDCCDIFVTNYLRPCQVNVAKKSNAQHN